MTRTLDVVAAVLFATGTTLVVAPVARAAECTCRLPGQQRVELGGTACLPTPQGPRLARCVIDVNITSWKNLNLPCPVSAAPEAEPLRRSAALWRTQ